MDKLLPLLALIVTASISVNGPAMAEWRFPGALSSSFVTGLKAVVLVAGKGGGTTGGMGGGAATGGMGGSAATGGIGGGAATGGMSGGLFNNPPPSFGTNSSGAWTGNSAQPSYYTYQCVTPSDQCSFVAPATFRSSSLRPGARCSCSDGLSQGQIK